MNSQEAKYIPENRIESIDPLPVDKRSKTDFCCTIVNSTFVILLFIILLFTFKVQNLRKITYPNDSDGKMCGYDDENYPYLYFTSPTDITKRLCVSKCPTASDQSLSCKPTNGLSCNKNSNPKYQVQIYETKLEQARIGLICVPQDQALKNSIFQASGLQAKYQFLGFYDAMWRSLWISIIFALFYTLFAFFQPYIAVPWTIGLGGILSIVFGLIILIKADGYWFVKIILFVLFTLLGIYSFITIFVAARRQSIYICSRIMHSASLITYDKQFTQLPKLFSLQSFKKLLKPFAIVLIFILLFGIYLVLIAFQVLSAWSAATPTFDPNYPFYTVSGFGSSFLTFLILIQFVWGMSFLKEAFNFIVSSYAAHKYYSTGMQSQGNLNKRQPGFLLTTEILLRYHWGSVVGGSLMLGFFYFPDLFLNFFYPEHQKLYKKNGQNQRTGIGGQRQIQQDGNSVEAFFNLIREQSFAYTFLTGIPYCNSSRYCEMLSGQSQFYNYSQTTNRLFRLNMHMVPIVITLLLAIGSMQSTGKSSPYGIFCITMITFFVITFFVSYIGDVAEGLLIATYVQLGMQDESSLTLAPKIIRNAYKQDLEDYYTYEMDQRGQHTTERPWYKIFTEPTQT